MWPRLQPLHPTTGQGAIDALDAQLGCLWLDPPASQCQQSRACEEQQQLQPGCDLLTLLHHLPPDVVHGSCVAQLGPCARGALRATCAGLRNLVDGVGCLSLLVRLGLPMPRDHASLRAWAELEHALPRFQRLQTLTLVITSPLPSYEQPPGPDVSAATAAALARILCSAARTQLKHLILRATCVPLSPDLVQAAATTAAGPQLHSVCIHSYLPHTPPHNTRHAAVRAAPITIPQPLPPTAPAPTHNPNMAAAAVTAEPMAAAAEAGGQAVVTGSSSAAGAAASAAAAAAAAVTATDRSSSATLGAVSASTVVKRGLPMPGAASEWGQILATAVQSVQQLELQVVPDSGRLMQTGDISAFLTAVGLACSPPPAHPPHQAWVSRVVLSRRGVQEMGLAVRKGLQRASPALGAWLGALVLDALELDAGDDVAMRMAGLLQQQPAHTPSRRRHGVHVAAGSPHGTHMPASSYAPQHSSHGGGNAGRVSSNAVLAVPVPCMPSCHALSSLTLTGPGPWEQLSILGTSLPTLSHLTLGSRFPVPQLLSQLASSGLSQLATLTLGLGVHLKAGLVAGLLGSGMPAAQPGGTRNTPQPSSGTYGALHGTSSMGNSALLHPSCHLILEAPVDWLPAPIINPGNLVDETWARVREDIHALAYHPGGFSCTMRSSERGLSPCGMLNVLSRIRFGLLLFLWPTRPAMYARLGTELQVLVRARKLQALGLLAPKAASKEHLAALVGAAGAAADGSGGGCGEGTCGVPGEGWAGLHTLVVGGLGREALGMLLQGLPAGRTALNASEHALQLAECPAQRALSNSVLEGVNGNSGSGWGAPSGTWPMFTAAGTEVPLLAGSIWGQGGLPGYRKMVCAVTQPNDSIISSSCLFSQGQGSSALPEAVAQPWSCVPQPAQQLPFFTSLRGGIPPGGGLDAVQQTGVISAAPAVGASTWPLLEQVRHVVLTDHAFGVRTGSGSTSSDISSTVDLVEQALFVETLVSSLVERSSTGVSVQVVVPLGSGPGWGAWVQGIVSGAQGQLVERGCDPDILREVLCI